MGTASANKNHKLTYNADSKKRSRLFDKGKKNLMSTIFDSQKITKRNEHFSPSKTIPSVLEDFEESNRAISHDHYESELNYHDKSQFQTLDHNNIRINEDFKKRISQKEISTKYSKNNQMPKHTRINLVNNKVQTNFQAKLKDHVNSKLR